MGTQANNTTFEYLTLSSSSYLSMLLCIWNWSYEVDSYSNVFDHLEELKFRIDNFGLACRTQCWSICISISLVIVVVAAFGMKGQWYSDRGSSFLLFNSCVISEQISLLLYTWVPFFLWNIDNNSTYLIELLGG